MWMVVNKLTLNIPKTEFLNLDTTKQTAKRYDLLAINVFNIQPIIKVDPNLGVIFNEHLTYQTHIACISQLAYYQLYKIQKGMS